MIQGIAVIGGNVLESGDIYAQEQQFFQFVASRTLERIDDRIKTLTCPVLYPNRTPCISLNVTTICSHLKESHH